MNGSDMTGRKGFRNLKTLQTLTNAAQPRQRHQVASKFARLENERARLERELVMWEARRHSVEQKLEALSEEIEALQPLLMGETTRIAGHQPVQKRPTPRHAAAVPNPAEQRIRTMALEY